MEVTTSNIEVTVAPIVRSIVILYLYSQHVKSEKTFVECKSQLVTSDRDAIDIAT